MLTGTAKNSEVLSAAAPSLMSASRILQLLLRRWRRVVVLVMFGTYLLFLTLLSADPHRASEVFFGQSFTGWCHEDPRRCIHRADLRVGTEFKLVIAVVSCELTTAVAMDTLASGSTLEKDLLNVPRGDGVFISPSLCGPISIPHAVACVRMYRAFRNLNRWKEVRFIDVSMVLQNDSSSSAFPLSCSGNYDPAYKAAMSSQSPGTSNHYPNKNAAEQFQETIQSVAFQQTYETVFPTIELLRAAVIPGRRVLDTAMSRSEKQRWWGLSGPEQRLRIDAANATLKMYNNHQGAIVSHLIFVAEDVVFIPASLHEINMRVGALLSPPQDTYNPIIDVSAISRKRLLSSLAEKNLAPTLVVLLSEADQEAVFTSQEIEWMVEPFDVSLVTGMKKGKLFSSADSPFPRRTTVVTIPRPFRIGGERRHIRLAMMTVHPASQDVLLQV